MLGKEAIDNPIFFDLLCLDILCTRAA